MAELQLQMVGSITRKIFLNNFNIDLLVRGQDYEPLIDTSSLAFELIFAVAKQQTI